MSNALAIAHVDDEEGDVLQLGEVAELMVKPDGRVLRLVPPVLQGVVDVAEIAEAEVEPDGDMIYFMPPPVLIPPPKRRRSRQQPEHAPEQGLFRDFPDPDEAPVEGWGLRNPYDVELLAWTANV